MIDLRKAVMELAVPLTEPGRIQARVWLSVQQGVLLGNSSPNRGPFIYYVIQVGGRGGKQKYDTL